MPRSLPALVLLVLFLAGCAAPAADTVPEGDDARPKGLSEIQFALLPGESVFHEASVDGTRLHMRLFRPDAPESWKAPVILVMSPYFQPDSREGYDPMDPRTWDAAGMPDYWRYRWLVDHFVPRGYAVALSDVRGTGESGGCLEQTGRLQTQDGYDTVEMLGTQPWSNGRVGMYGKSYDGETQQSTATLAPPQLTTIVPVSSVAGQYDYSYYDGVPYPFQTMLSNAGYAATGGLVPGTTRESLLAYPERVGCNADHARQGADPSGDWTPYWEEREFRRNAEAVRASVLYVHGLQDWNVKPNNVRDWLERLDVPRLALLGQWGHDYPEENRVHPDWSRQDWQELVWRWYDHWLLGRDTGIEAMLGQIQVQDTLGRWRLEPTFPPPATMRRYHLAGDALADAPPAQETPRAYVEPLGPAAVAGPAPEGLAYETAQLGARLHWSGWPLLDVNVSLDKDDAHFAAHLYDVAPDGKATWVARGYLSAQHRDGVEQPQPVPVGETISYRIRFHPSDVVIEKDHRLRLVLMPHDDETLGAENGARATFHGGSLLLPVVTPEADDFLHPPMGKPITAPVT